MKYILTLSSIYTHSIACWNSVDPDLSAHPYCMVRICTVCFMVRNKLINKNMNSADPDQMARMCRLIQIYTIYPRHNGVYMEERVNHPYFFNPWHMANIPWATRVDADQPAHPSILIWIYTSGILFI